MISKKDKVSDKTKEEAVKIARATQRPGQTKEQTKLIAQGIQKGIDLYKKQQNAKARELDKKLKMAANKYANASPANDTLEPVAVENNKLPWVLLIVSWLGFAAYIMLRN